MAQTLIQIQQSLEDNASYEENGSLAECKLFIAACKNYITRGFSSSSNESSSMTLNVPEVRAMLIEAQTYYRQNTTTAANSRNAFASFSSGFRT